MGFGALPPVTRRRVVVTGIGLVTPLGISTKSTWENVLAAKSGTRPLRDVPFYLPSCISNNKAYDDAEKARRLDALVATIPSQVAAPVMDADSVHDDELVFGAQSEGRGAPRRKPIVFAANSHEPRAFRFSEKAAEEAMRDAGFSDPSSATGFRFPCSSERIGVNVGMGIPSLADVTDVSTALFADPANIHYSQVNPFFVPKILGNMAAGALSIQYQLTGPIGSGVAACATGAYCIGEAVEKVRCGKADVMVCGATESCITPVSVAGFARMRALCSKYNKDPQRASRPFDEGRGGFVIGEGAGIFIVEALEVALARNAKIYAEVRGFGVSSDAHHVAQPHPDGRGARQCVRAALEDGGVPPHAVAYVNAHATGTMGDTIELAALEAELCASGTGASRHSPLLVSSSKGALGHLLGAAGSVEAAITLLALQTGQAPPNVNLEKPVRPLDDPTLQLVPFKNGGTPFKVTPDTAVISTSFGFGGMNTAVVFTPVSEKS